MQVSTSPENRLKVLRSNSVFTYWPFSMMSILCLWFHNRKKKITVAPMTIPTIGIMVTIICAAVDGIFRSLSALPCAGNA